MVYADNDPLVLIHAQALVVSTPQGATDYIEADLNEPDTILDSAALTLDFSRPAALILMGIVAHISDHDEAMAIVSRLLDGVPSGSYLAIRDGADTNRAYSQAIDRCNRSGLVPYHLRTPEQIARYLDGLEVVAPGVVSCPLWRPEVVDTGTPVERAVYGGVGRKT
jgi:hypothetical protein